MLNAMERRLQDVAGSGACARGCDASSTTFAWLWQLHSTTVLVLGRRRWRCSRTPPYGDRRPAPERGRVRWSARRTTCRGTRSLHLPGRGQSSSPSLRGRRGVTAPCGAPQEKRQALKKKGRKVEEKEQRRREFSSLLAVPRELRTPAQGRGALCQGDRLSSSLPGRRKRKKRRKKKLPKLRASSSRGSCWPHSTSGTVVGSLYRHPCVSVRASAH